jgi:glycine/serine hydroxymethyltransferase
MSCIGSALVSSQHTHHSAALFLSTLEMDLFGAEYARQVVANAQALCDELEARGFELLEYADQRTQSHQLLALPPKGISAGEAGTKLFASGISTNAREVYGKEVMRFGVQEVTRRGMGRGEMSVIAELVKRALLDGEPSARLRGRVAALRADFKTVRFSFDDL